MKTALVLAGGGSRGAYEVGVWQALNELGIKIDIVTGTSIGSMNATLIAAGKFKQARRLWLTLETAEVFDYKHAIENKGIKFTSVKDIMADCISEDDVRNSDIDLGIVTVEIPSMKAHHLWKEDIPKGGLLDYVFASCSCFPFVVPYEIDGKSFVDGGFDDTMPIGMALSKKPDRVIAVNLACSGKYRKSDIKKAGDRLILIESAWNLGNFAVFNPEHSEDIMRLGYLDTMKAFGVFTGRKFTFLRGQIPAKDIPKAETAAELLGLDPKVIYSREVFEETIVRTVNNAKDKINKHGAIDKLGDLDDWVAGNLHKIGINFPDDVSEYMLNKLNLDENTRELLRKIL